MYIRNVPGVFNSGEHHEKKPNTIPLSVIIPIHRRDLDIERCINSLLADKTLDLQIIVAANSDSEEELNKIRQKVLKCYLNTPCVRLLSIQKAGKANAINNALQHVKNEIVLIGDADTYFCQEGLNRCLSVILNDPTVVAVNGNVGVFEKNFLSGIQRFEYWRIYHIFRPLWNRINANLIISGCAGIFRTKLLFEAGLYDTDTLGEDFEITLRLHVYHILQGKKYKIQYLNTELAKTDVPQDFKSLVEQRRRWFLGFLQVTMRYRYILLHPVVYRHIFLSFAFAVITEKWSNFLKWVLIAVSIGVCVRCGIFAFHGVLSEFLIFWVFEMLFNSFAMKILHCSDRKHTGLVGAGFLTLCLMIFQFVMKDINVFYALGKKNRMKGNKWM